MKASEDAATDGGQHTDEELFGQVGGEQSSVSRSERFSRVLDAYVLAPGRVAWNDWRAQFGTAVISLFLLTGTIGVLLVDRHYSNYAPVYVQPFESWQYPLGTDGFGVPIGSQLIHATPAMIKMVFAGAVVSISAATIIGITAGYKGGTADTVLMFLTDIVLTIPGLPLVIVIASIYPPRDPFLVGAVLAIDNWPGLARALRSQVLTIRGEAYVEASRAMGIPSHSILSKDILPKLMPYVLINAANAARSVIFESVALYFLGVLPFTTFNWGVMMNLAYTEGNALVDLSHFYVLFWPMLVIVFLSSGLILFSQGMDRVFNPRIRARHAKKVGGDEEQPHLD